jgi:hypothetical protein
MDLACQIALEATSTVAIEENGRREIDIKRYAKVEKVKKFTLIYILHDIVMICLWTTMYFEPVIFYKCCLTKCTKYKYKEWCVFAQKNLAISFFLQGYNFYLFFLTIMI